jgi:hypothetical protein
MSDEWPEIIAAVARKSLRIAPEIAVHRRGEAS